jgi:hypothetical protein
MAYRFCPFTPTIQTAQGTIDPHAIMLTSQCFGSAKARGSSSRLRDCSCVWLKVSEQKGSEFGPEELGMNTETHMAEYQTFIAFVIARCRTAWACY